VASAAKNATRLGTNDAKHVLDFGGAEKVRIMNVQTSKNDLVLELFVRTADENYITARWCAFNLLNTEFLWLSVHVLEKYLKAVLLVNGKSSKSYGHDIERLYRDVKSIAGSLLPDKPHHPSIFYNSLLRVLKVV
jgi:hypothetical protein